MTVCPECNYASSPREFTEFDNDKQQYIRKCPACEYVIEKVKTGRPTKYNEKYHPVLAYYMAMAGRIDEEIASEIGVALSKMKEWKKKFTEFRDALEDGKARVDGMVENALLKKSLGFKEAAVKYFKIGGEIIEKHYDHYYPPETAAIKHWLANRLPKKWRDRVEVDVTGVNKVVHEIIFDDVEGGISDAEKEKSEEA